MQDTEKPSILFVCTANIIRSPIAEAVFKRIIQRYPSLEGWQVGSAGVQGLAGFPADPSAITVVRGMGIDLSQHVARRVSQDLLDGYDLILTMEKSQKDFLNRIYPSQADKVHFLGEVSGVRDDVYDPLGGTLQDYLSASRMIETSLEQRSLRILLAALVNSLKRLGLPYPDYPLFINLGNEIIGDERPEEIDEVEWFFRRLISLPLEDQYCFLQVLHQLKPYHEEFHLELQQVAEMISPPDYESRWLKEIFFHEVALPITCLKKMTERSYVHPAIQAELEQIKSRLHDPNCQQLYVELEKLFKRNLDEQKYLFNIWDLRAVYKNMPFTNDEYIEAYSHLRVK